MITAAISTTRSSNNGGGGGGGCALNKYERLNGSKAQRK